MLLWQLSMNVQSFVPRDDHVLQCYSAMKTHYGLYIEQFVVLQKNFMVLKLDDY